MLETRFFPTGVRTLLARLQWSGRNTIPSPTNANDPQTGAAQRLQAILDTVLDGIVTIDEQGRIESFNTAASNIFGYAANEVIGRNVGLLMPEAEARTHDDHLRRYSRTSKSTIIGVERETFRLEEKILGIKLFLGVSKVILCGKYVWFECSR